mmetsp:Transcript_30730/g.50052  ORF Transcript_30730/g.50052 Transcript_30730/m.50052 type:complete len:297 (-) Transcript_30730:592-1482(-)
MLSSCGKGAFGMRPIFLLSVTALIWGVSVQSCSLRLMVPGRRRFWLCMCPSPTALPSSALILYSGKPPSMLFLISWSPPSSRTLFRGRRVCTSFRPTMFLPTRSLLRRAAKGSTRSVLCWMEVSRSGASPLLTPGRRLFPMLAGVSFCTYALWRIWSFSLLTSAMPLFRCRCPRRGRALRRCMSRCPLGWMFRRGWSLSWIGRLRVPGRPATCGTSSCGVFSAAGVLFRSILLRPSMSRALLLGVISRCWPFMWTMSRLPRSPLLFSSSFWTSLVLSSSTSSRPPLSLWAMILSNL